MSDMKKVTLVLSDGTKFHGKSFGYDEIGRAHV